MGMSAADRQRQYRQRHLREGTDERLNLVVRAQAKRQLERLARHHGVTQRAMLEQLLADAEQDVVDTLSDQAGYHDGVTA